MKTLKSYQLQDFFEFLALFISLIGSYVSIVTYFSESKTYWGWGLGVWLLVVGLTVAALLKIHKLRKVSIVRLKDFSAKFHSIAHNLRNHHSRLCKRYKNDQRPLTKDELISNIEHVCSDVVNSLSALLNQSTGEHVSVSIKYFWVDSPLKSSHLSDEDLADLKVTTLCRCQNTQKKDKRQDPKPVRGNTDLEKITIDKENHFFSGDIRDYNLKLRNTNNKPYVDSNPFWQEIYNARITVPIRIDLSFAKQGIQKGKSYDLIGFITADSLSNSAFREEEIRNYVHLCKGVADMLYRYLERFIYLWNNI